ncbi:3-hydroxyanthranilate 3,4-dioxygenase-like [Argiope bruennichi]|uniref:3-hydroxyanthranilate 3,4-dioxygenase-like n=1 Tax=Argiope bruennichi TaxID=94029 RepID=UPI002494F455|nr:3-hydroxyanthranilate 3,4-dioxygenase-like [Argiope bruennichi]
MDPIQYDINKWLEENKKFFVPPICNKLMYKDGQLKAFFVGGPNSRKDFHMEEGEEFFYMLKGDMRLVVHEKGRFRDIKIREGEVFLLPSRIPHSPQRIADTIGLVIERERAPNETDLLRYYIDGTDDILYEKWFRCENLEELGPLIKEYFNSEAYKTGKPIPGSLLEDKPIKQDFERNLGDPFSLQEWLESNKEILDKEGKKKLFDGHYVSRIDVLGKGEHFPDNDLPETFLWQIEGKSRITVDEKPYDFLKNQTMLIQSGSRYSILNDAGSRTLSVVMNPV